jgi:hypothetical protein
MLGQQVNKLVFFIVRNIVIPFGLQKKEIISGQEFQRKTKVANFLGSNFLHYVGNLT